MKFLGTGSALPKKVVSNDDLAQVMDTSDEWIRSRTGIGMRHIAVEETTTSMAVEAAEKALADAKISGSSREPFPRITYFHRWRVKYRLQLEQKVQRHLI